MLILRTGLVPERLGVRWRAASARSPKRLFYAELVPLAFYGLARPDPHAAPDPVQQHIHLGEGC